MSVVLRRVVPLAIGVLLSVEHAGAAEVAPLTSLRPVARTEVSLTARWDHRPGSPAWTRAALRALRGHARALPQLTPRDIADWCPAYPTGTIQQREAFWIGPISALAKHESTWRPTAVGGGGLWYGLLQILPDTARRYNCRARSGEALKNPVDNLSCGLRIMAVTVPRDGVVSRDMRGVAADWGPFHSRTKREDMMRWTRSQSYCTALGRSLRPVARRDLQGPVRP
ncbi:transglycosylase SLT domain-containing protein [Mesobacterium sp. TK19101]|uniref:Transglycosylase SLT domain-containing protein n=1 Tax=Mesobacterium hydrothermale TaxID=3111907 RepID=A0ABU6HHJ0_9RHOB|nr:transglycosylase SLT domain-containing protein [Mesobacterium sp. TK19101]MEC3861914.1 transglycosylase SLT domain-containing protein [Mesobacterium sp. TK19101]